uniref:Uncharacterized protein n=1 Tax=Anguilla anguilla TaxID=7936 RepID=A0A0E9V0Z7_ANGAN
MKTLCYTTKCALVRSNIPTSQNVKYN